MPDSENTQRKGEQMHQGETFKNGEKKSGFDGIVDGLFNKELLSYWLNEEKGEKPHTGNIIDEDKKAANLLISTVRGSFQDHRDPKKLLQANTEFANDAKRRFLTEKSYKIPNHNRNRREVMYNGTADREVHNQLKRRAFEQDAGWFAIRANDIIRR